MTLLDDFNRVTKNSPCPICGRPDWCLIERGEDPSKVVCARVPSSCRWSEAGWLHRLGTAPSTPKSGCGVVRIPTAGKSPELGPFAERFQAAVSVSALARLSASLGVSVESLRRLEVGWSGRAWSFPMRDRSGRVCGIRLRTNAGRKLAVKGGKEGLFIPRGLFGDGQLLAAEGPTDTAALLDLGFDAVGRPSCRGGLKLLVDLVRRGSWASVVVVADADGPGLGGAWDLATVLAPYCGLVRLLVPGAKDARAWVNQGATAATVRAAIDAADHVQCRVAVRRAAS